MEVSLEPQKPEKPLLPKGKENWEMLTLEEVQAMKERIWEAQLQEPRRARRQRLQEIYNQLAELYSYMLTNQDV